MKNKISSFRCFGKGSSPKTPEILRLGPNTEGSINGPNQHYVDYIKKALSDPKIYNIGLIGDYASGKSTIIENFLDDNKKKNVIRLSLAKISLETNDKTKTNDKTETNDKTKTNTIKEKILELLFWQAKVAVPNSILQSVYKPNKLLQGFSAFLFSLVFASIAFNKINLDIAFFNKIDLHIAFITFNKINLDIVLLGNYAKISFYMVLLGCFSLIFWQLINFFIFLKNLGFSKINLKAQNFDLEISENPFYKHLAQIIFILEEIAKKNYFVLVEDLDRFNDIEIFTALREISLIINYRLKNKTLTFLYALNSGLFVPKDNSQNSANQDKNSQKSVNDICKFFDVIIPVLKFSNNHTAKEEILELIAKEKTINSAEKDELEKVLEILCTNAVIDQRIAHNICNQYRFIERLKFGDKIYDKDNKARAKLLAMTIFSIFDPKEYNALNNAKGAVWQLLEKYQLEKYHLLALTQDAIEYFKKIGGNFFAKEALSSFDSEEFSRFLFRIIEFLKNLKSNGHSFFIKDNKDIELGITDIIRKQEPNQSENLDTGYYINKEFDILPDSRKVGIFLRNINIEVDTRKYQGFFQIFFEEQMQNNSRNKLNSTLISNASKELIKQKYIEKDYRDYLNRDPFQKDKVDSLAKQLFKAITKIIKAILS